MIINILLLVCVLGWAINTAAFQAGGNRSWIPNAVLCIVFAAVFVMRVS